MLNGKKVVALIQARCTSTRLPLKHFRYIGDKMLIDWVVDRLESINEIDEIIISTTNDVSDIPLKEYAEQKGIGFYGFDGDINDVVGRHYNALKNLNAKYVVYVSGDCCLADTDYLKEALYKLEEGFDYIRAKKWSEYMIEGMEVFNNKALEELNNESITEYERENFSYIVERKPLNINMGYVQLKDIFRGRNYRISVDNLADLRFMNEIFKELKNQNKEFNIQNTLSLLKESLELKSINNHIEQKKAGEKTYKILIKTEASDSIGLGHLKRMMTLGQYLNENKNNGVFYAINKNECAKKILKDNGYIYDFEIAQNEDELIKYINSCKADILIIDVQKLQGGTCYNFDKIKKLTGIKKIILIDKYMNDDNVDLCILQGIQSDETLNKINRYKVIHGLKTIFINNDFRKIKYDPKDEIVISFGGSDINNFTTKVVALINKIHINKQYKYKFILGPYFKFETELNRELSNFKYEYEMVKNPISIAQEIKNASLGIVYYGVSFYEFLFLGIPTINIITDKQYEDEFKNVQKTLNIEQCGIVPNINCEKLEYYINNIDKLNLNKFNISDMNYMYENIIKNVN